MRIYNGEDITVTIVTNCNPDVIVRPYEIIELDTSDTFNSDNFYVLEDGEWYGKYNGITGADIEIYRA